MVFDRISCDYCIVSTASERGLISQWLCEESVILESDQRTPFCNDFSSSQFADETMSREGMVSL